jgi:transcription elongation factor GreA
MSVYMTVKTYKLTAQKIKELEKALQKIDEVECPRITRRIEELRKHTIEELDSSLADLLEEKAAIEKKRFTIKHMLENYELVKVSKAGGIVGLGSTVDLKFGNFNVSYQIVSSEEANPLESKISVESEVGSALLGKKAGETVSIDNGITVLDYEILAVK